MELKETEKRLLDAVSHIIENDGFTKIGVNRIASQAGCDKVLIYRYFGGLDGLLVEWAKRHDYYSFAYSEFIDTIKQSEKEDIRQIVKDVLFRQLHYLKDNVLMQQLLVWELSGHSSFKGILEERERIGYKLQEELNKSLDIGNDNDMSVAIIISAINYIVLFTRQYPKLNDIDFSKPEAWSRMEAMISKYVDFIFDDSKL
ncbi:TetR/AcrR family transcriptional regulator [Bacteroides ovatus]|uniref:TetR/AcrR family transcriptional regulator n=1 Tax=Bacteroides ovatus TaxID=28116 RepID=UPI001F3FD34A|nr:TetR/AcrR family transcriptional regulator [Bacteroides ovatus]MCE9162832.1 TetR/AcrR family transcriptional regulator [Bacteroides ovatus]